jgi:hypothetical protein
MKTKFLTPLFFLVLVSFSLYSCTDDSVTDATKKNTLIGKVTAPVADEGDNTIVEPIVIRPR